VVGDDRDLSAKFVDQVLQYSLWKKAGRWKMSEQFKINERHVRLSCFSLTNASCIEF
jgi:hypothetical protein